MSFLIIVSIVGFPTELNTQKSSFRIVVIDAGHGGRDPGCMSFHKTKEKDITLSIALKLGEMIENQMEDVKVIYTRKDDKFVELHQRAAIANKNQADLFISIHCNAHHDRKKNGTETYVMGLHKNNQNLEVMKLENEVIKHESEEALHHYSDIDFNSPDAHILISLHQNAYLNRSLKVASMTQDKITNKVSLSDRGVKQAGFIVLWKTAMPSILVETGFLTNEQNEQILTSKMGQIKIADGIFEAVKQYRENLIAKVNH